MAESNRPAAKPLTLQLSISPEGSNDLLDFLRQIVTSSVAQALSSREQGSPEIQSAPPNKPQSSGGITRGIELTEAARVKAGDLRIDLLMGKIPENTGILIDTATTAKLLGVSSHTLYRLHLTGATPNPVLIGGKIKRWRLAELLEWIEAGCPPRKLWNYKGQGTSQKRSSR